MGFKKSKCFHSSNCLLKSHIYSITLNIFRESFFLVKTSFFLPIHKKSARLFLVVVLLGSAISFGLTNNLPVSTVKNLTKPIYSDGSKVYVHFDKSHYWVGETVWFKIYLMDDRSHQLKKEKAIVYIDLFDEKSKIEASKIIQTVNGLGDNNIKLSSSLKSGTYTVRVYTKRMLKNDPSSIFERNILVYTPEMSSNGFKAAHTDAQISQLNVDFFSEGNSLKNGAVARIGIKSFNSCGTGVGLKGEIRDEKNNRIVAFYTSKSGLGSFSFLWDCTKEYKAWIYSNNETT